MDVTTVSSAGRDSDHPRGERSPLAGDPIGGSTERATMRDVAALAGVSLKTVSRVVNREAGVSPEVVVKVTRAVERLNYRHNVGASNLRSRRTGVIGALLQDVSNSFSAGLLRALEDVARGRRHVVLTASLDEEVERERQLVGDLVGRRVDGLILMPASRDHSYLAPDLRAGLRVVFVDREPHGIVTDSVLVDNVTGAFEATRHLLRQGHRRILHLGDLETIETAHQRQLGYEAALRTGGIRLDRELVLSGQRTSEMGEETLMRVFTSPSPPTAVFASRNSVAIGAARALRRLGLSHQIALVGFDDFPLADLLEPGLTVVRQDVAYIGRMAATILYARIDGDTSPAERHLVPPTLVQRGSGEIPPRA